MHAQWARWRIEFKTDDLNAQRCKVLLEKQTMVIGGIDRHNRLTIICAARYHNAGAYSTEDLVNYGLFIVEQATKIIKQRNLNP
jgi:hypothetical protein